MFDDQSIISFLHEPFEGTQGADGNNLRVGDLSIRKLDSLQGLCFVEKFCIYFVTLIPGNAVDQGIAAVRGNAV